MIITTGKSIKVELMRGRIVMVRSSDRPGIVELCIDGVSVLLPANDEEKQEFMRAYEKVCAENIEYRKTEVV